MVTIPREGQPRRISRRHFLPLGAAALGGAALAAYGATRLRSEGESSVVSNSDSTTSATPAVDNGQHAVVDVTPTGTPKEVRKEPTTLREAADLSGMKVGVASAIGGNDRDRFRILDTQFNQLTIGSISMSSINPTARGEYNFNVPNFYVQKAQDARQNALGMHLVWGSDGVNAGVTSDIPQWLSKGNFSKQQHIEIMQDHIRTVMEQYKGKIKDWVVVNEATRATYWNRVIGPEYVQLAFEAARSVDPNATLIFNDFGGEYQGAPKSNQIFAAVKSLKEKGLVDAVGMQMHMIGEGVHINPAKPPTKEMITAEMRRYADIGVDVYITELDVASNFFPGPKENQERLQAEVYKLPFQAALESGGACRNISIWGVNDESSWRANGSPLLFSKNQPKPAFHAVFETLKTAS